MIWVCRAGRNAVFLNEFLKSEKIYLAWDGYRANLSQFQTREQMKNLVRQEKGDVARTSVSNWSGQLYSFCWEMKKDDYVLIPHEGSRVYTLARVVGDYSYCDTDTNELWHSRKIKLLLSGIPREIFSQTMRYSLGAYRTIFKVRDEHELLSTITRYKSKMDNK